MIGISSCLLGVNCKYDGHNNLKEELLYLKDEAILLCPEVLGGLSSPRSPSEIVNGKVINKDSEDVTKQFMIGAKKALDICKKNNVDFVILKSNSPSCGCGQIYDGTFSKTLIEGDGIFTKLLKENNINCIDDKSFIGGK